MLHIKTVALLLFAILEFSFQSFCGAIMSMAIPIKYFCVNPLIQLIEEGRKGMAPGMLRGIIRRVTIRV